MEAGKLSKRVRWSCNVFSDLFLEIILRHIHNVMLYRSGLLSVERNYTGHEYKAVGIPGDILEAGYHVIEDRVFQMDEGE